MQLSRSRCAVLLAAAIMMFLGLSSVALAQTTAVASVGGVITDSTGKVIVNAQVLITETDKGQVRTATTNLEGQYTFANLPTGAYRLEVKSPGFKDYAQSGLVLQVGNNIQVNVSMQVGSVSERVEVTAATNLVETKENSISSVVDQRSISELPLNGRQAVNLIFSIGAAS